MSLRRKQHKCLGCRGLFFSDYRNVGHQRYCGKPDCRKLSKKASQRRWLRKPKNWDVFRGSANVLRVQRWREAHPGYWKGRKLKTPQPDDPQMTQPEEVSSVQSSCNVPGSPLGTLQDFCLAKDPGFIGLLSMVTGRTLQDEIQVIARRVVEEGRQIMGLTLPQERNHNQHLLHDYQASPARRPTEANPAKL